MSAERRRRRAGFLLVVATLWLAASRSNAADAEIAPSVDGYIGAWLLAGPLSEPSQRALTGDSPRVRGPWRPIAHGAGALDVLKMLKAENDAGMRAALGGVLRLDYPLDGLLLVGADGDLGVFVDGKLAHERALPHLRGSAWDVVPLGLAAGDHDIVILLGHRVPHWAALVRLLDRRDLTAPAGARLVLRDVSPVDVQRMQKLLITVEADARPSSAGHAPAITVQTRRGVVRNADLEITATLRAGKLVRELRLGQLPIGPRGTTPFTARLTVTPLAGDATVAVRVGAVERSSKLSLDTGVSDALTAAEAALSRPDVRDDVARATLEYEMGLLEGYGGAWEQRTMAAERAARLRRLAAEVLAGRDPFASSEGVFEIARFSPLDGAPHPLMLHVPKGHSRRDAEPRPLVVALHGYGGRPESIMEAFVGRKSREPHPRIDGFVVAPEAFGDAFYRGPGEADVMSAIDWALKRYSVDPDRVSITGVSMGGTGVSHIAFRYAEHFAAAAPLAGYHSYFVRRDTRGKHLADWERSQMHHWSPVSWADNGRNLPLHVAHGTEDHPLENSRVLTDRYEKLGYPLVAEWPPIGHSVWRITYKDARFWPVLTAKRRQRPAHVTIQTDAMRYGHQHFATLTDIAVPGAMARLDVHEVGQADVQVKTEHVAAFRLDARASATRIAVDGSAFDMPAGSPIQLRRTRSGWQPGPADPPPGHKRAGLEGPIRDVFLGPVVFVYGTDDPSMTRANRETAEHFATRFTGSARYPVLADSLATAAAIAGKNLFLVGSPGGNSVLGAIAAKLPIGVREGALDIAGRRYSAPGTGALFIYPDPNQPDRYVVVLTAASARGIWRAASLPNLLPDYVVYDDGVAPAAASQVLGDAAVLEAGFFGRDWSVPARER